MVYELLRIGFTEEQIKEYTETKRKYTLDEILKDTNVKIDVVIKTTLLFNLYKFDNTFI